MPGCPVARDLFTGLVPGGQRSKASQARSDVAALSTAVYTAFCL